MCSIASWCPSQAEPLVVSYMCQSQLSSPMLPSAAPMPPCAATVCERVGNTLERTATRSPACAASSEARIPAPPAPTITASNLRTGIVMSASPQDARRPHEVEEEHERDGEFRGEAHRRGLHVIHDDVAHADPRVIEERGDEEHRPHLEPHLGEDGFPCRIVGRAVQDQREEREDRVAGH